MRGYIGITSSGGLLLQAYVSARLFGSWSSTQAMPMLNVSGISRVR